MDRKKIKNKNLFNIFQQIDKNTFVIGDTHFYHLNITFYHPSRQRYVIEGFDSPEEWFIYEWNEVVKEEDLVIHLGDVIWGREDKLEIVNQLKGRKILIMGNHEKFSIKTYYGYFDAVISGVYLIENEGLYKIETSDRLANAIIKTVGGKKIMFSHYPVYPTDEWDDKTTKELRKIFEGLKCDLNIHGHVHSNTLDNRRLFNASIENIDFRPVKIKDILS